VSDDDDRLRDAFAALRREDEARAPALAPLLVAPRARTAPRPRAPWLLVATAAALALVFVARAPQPPPEPPDDFAVGSWRMPSDVLLELPGAELLGSPRWETLEAPAREPIGPQSRIPGRSHG